MILIMIFFLNHQEKKTILSNSHRVGRLQI